jgi:hypothetical protein
VAVCSGFDAAGVTYEYEAFDIPYVPKKTRRYKPDILLSNGIILELKGRFTTEDRQKMLNVKTDHPDIEIRFVFSNPNTRISKQSKTTYADWCNTKGFKFCKASEFPRGWLTEPTNVASANAIAALRAK